MEVCVYLEEIIGDKESPRNSTLINYSIHFIVVIVITDEQLIQSHGCLI